MYDEFIKTGKKLQKEELIHSTSGNMSIKKGDVIYITRTGSTLSDLKFSDILKVNLKDTKKDKGASVEVNVHRAIYNYNPEISAIIHAHPVYSIVLSFENKFIKPIDIEGEYYLQEVPVIYWCKDTIGSECVESNIPNLISKHKIVIVRGHGAFSSGKTLEEAFCYLSVLESSCKIIYLRNLFTKSPPFSKGDLGGF
ncbi:MAG: class II aldolase/adducin family protein [Endomicrobiia bacterium]